MQPQEDAEELVRMRHVEAGAAAEKRGPALGQSAAGDFVEALESVGALGSIGVLGGDATRECFGVERLRIVVFMGGWVRELPP